MALGIAAQNCVLINRMSELAIGASPSLEILPLTDNQGAKKTGSKCCRGTQTNHINTKHHLVRDQASEEKIKFKFSSSCTMTAN